MDEARRWRAAGGSVVPLVAGRPFAALWGWDVRHPFTCRPTYRSIAHLPLAERIAQQRRGGVRAAILGEADEYAEVAESRQQRYIRTILSECFALSGVPDYEQPLDRALGALAEQRGVNLDTVAYDELCRHDDSMLFYPLYNYAGGDHGALHEQLLDPAAVIGLNDGGAHCAFICDASIPTYVLTHWARDRARGPRLPLPEAVRRLTSQPAQLYGFSDRGVLAIGTRADLNVIDHGRLELHMPHAVQDLPAGGTRLVQPATGYVATVVYGEITRRNGIDTGARPGRLVRRNAVWKEHGHEQ
jgi:N-acyl-D-aspartate/D-glutamate deacylase